MYIANPPQPAYHRDIPDNTQTLATKDPAETQQYTGPTIEQYPPGHTARTIQQKHLFNKQWPHASSFHNDNHTTEKFYNNQSKRIIF